MNFTRFLVNMGKLKNKRDEIRSDEQVRAKSNTFAVRSIVFSIVTIIFAIAGGFLIKFGLTNDSGVITIILCLLGGVFMVGAVVTLINAFIRAGFQLSVNKLPIGYISLIIALIILIASIAAAALIVVL